MGIEFSSLAYSGLAAVGLILVFAGAFRWIFSVWLVVIMFPVLLITTLLIVSPEIRGSIETLINQKKESLSYNGTQEVEINIKNKINQ